MMSPLRLLLSAFLVLPLGRLSAAEPLDDAEKTARELIAVRLETVRADTAWSSERELLASTVAALQEKAAREEEKLELTKSNTAKDREELETVRVKVAGARDDLQALETRLAALTARLDALRPGLPPRLSQALEMSFRTMADPAQPPAERLRQAMNSLNRCAQFNRLVTSGEEVLTLEGEPSAKSYAVIYWGLSHGYALDRTARRAWLGSPGPNGWRWEARPEAYERVTELFAVAADQADPTFVPVPAAGLKTAGATSRPATP